MYREFVKPCHKRMIEFIKSMGALAVQQQLLNKRTLLLLTKRQSVLCEITEYAKTIF